MGKDSYGSNWIEINPGWWINLRRIQAIRFDGAAKDGRGVKIDDEPYIVTQAVERAIQRWLSQREMKSG